MDDDERRELILDAEEKIFVLAQEREAINETINHLDEKLTEIADDLSSLKTRSSEFNNIGDIREEILSLKYAIENLKTGYSAISSSQENDIREIKTSVEELKSLLDSDTGRDLQTAINSIDKIQENFSRDSEHLISKLTDVNILLSSYPILSLSKDEINELKQRITEFRDLMEGLKELRSSLHGTILQFDDEIPRVGNICAIEVKRHIDESIHQDIEVLVDLMEPLRSELVGFRTDLNELVQKQQIFMEIVNSIEEVKATQESQYSDLSMQIQGIQVQGQTIQNLIHESNSSLEHYLKKTELFQNELNSNLDEHVQSFSTMSILFIVGLTSVVCLLFVALYFLIIY